MQSPMTGAPRLAAPAEPATGKQPFRSEHMDFSEALLTSEKLPMDLQDDTPAAASQASLHFGTSPHKQQTVTPMASPAIPALGTAMHADRSVPSTPALAGPNDRDHASHSHRAGFEVFSAGAGAENVSTPALSSGQKHHRHSGSARPSPLSTATHGPRTHDPSVFTVTDRRVRVTDADKDVPLYVVIRKWVQNDPDAELMPLPAHGDDLAEAKRSLAPKLPPVPPPSEEEVQLAQQHIQESMVGRVDEPASVEGLKKQLKEHWLRVRSQHSKRARLKITRFRSRLVALLQSAQPAPPPGMNGTLSLSDIPQEQQWA